ncbi:MAG: OsmC family protein [Chloroflexota bacterium]|jgi:putative redox protein|nr:OsmC family protein [Chloroflexota bacterium]
MSTKTASVALDGQHMRFEGRTGSGHAVVLDGSEGDSGARPVELLPLALAGCTAMDVISILRKKRQEVTRYEVRTSGTQRDEAPFVFTRIDVVHDVVGPDLDVEAVRRAIELSATRYCAVGSTLATGVTEIHHSYVVTDPDGGRRSGEVVVLGPGGEVRTIDPVEVG